MGEVTRPYAIADDEDDAAGQDDESSVDAWPLSSHVCALDDSDGAERMRELEQVPQLWEERNQPPAAPPGTVAPGQELSRQMAYRVMRDAVALQLARRGFDGLRGAALWLVAELAGDFARALGQQLAQVPLPPSPYTPAALAPLVRRVQRHTLLFNAAEWHHMTLTFARTMDGERLAGTVASQLQQVQPWRGGPPPPKSVQAIYSNMRCVWHYKQTGVGRAAHVAAGQAEAPPSVDTKQPQLLAHSIRLNRKQRQLADTWTYHCARTAGPMLLPGLPAAEAAAAGEQKGRKRKADGKAAAAAAAAAAGAAGGVGGVGGGAGVPGLARVGSSGGLGPLVPQ